MKQNKILLTAILAMFVLAVLPVMSAANITSVWNILPATTAQNGTNATGSFTYNCTTAAMHITNVTVYANSSAGTMNALESFANASPDQTAWTGTVDIQAADDGLNQNLSCYANNATDGVYSDQKTCSAVTLDSTDPICSLVRLSKTIAWKGTQKITWSSSDATSLVSTAVYVDRPESGSTLSYTDTSRTLTLLSQDTKYLGDWTANITGTDRPGNTCTVEVTFKTYMPDGVGEIGVPAPKKDTGKTLLLLLIVGIALYFIFKKK